jgi:hypothetical protein
MLSRAWRVLHIGGPYFSYLRYRAPQHFALLFALFRERFHV